MAKRIAKRRPAAISVLRGADGAFRLAGGRDWVVEAARSAGGYAVSGAGVGAGWFLREAATGRGFVLRAGAGSDAEEIARSSRLAGSSGATILLGDGRLFRVEARVSERGSWVELTGWEISGAYWLARPGRDAWRIASSIAGKRLSAGTELMVLFAAELLAGARERDG